MLERSGSPEPSEPTASPTGADRPRLVPGSLALRRMYRGRHVIWVQACRVVADDERGLLLWLPAGSGFAHRPQPSDVDPRSPRLVDGLGALPVLIEHWRDHDVLILVPDDVPYSVWWFFTGGRFTSWYVNLERPSVRWRRGETYGIDSFDHALDVVITSDRRWRWKDEDELAERVGLPGYWGASTAEAIRADGRRVVATVEAGRFPYDGTWCDFRPDPHWPVPALPPRPVWDTPPAWT